MIGGRIRSGLARLLGVTPERTLVERPSPKGYRGGEQFAFDPDWSPWAEGVNAQADRLLGRIRPRVRWLCDSDPYIAGAVETIVGNVVGKRIRFQPNTRFDEFNRRLKAVLEADAECVDPWTGMSLYESQQMSYRDQVVAGDVLNHYPFAEPYAARSFSGGPAIEIIPAERLPLELSEQGNGGNGRVIRQGVEYDAQNRVAAFHVRKRAPMDGWMGRDAFALPAAGGPGMVRIAAAHAVLAMKPRRPGQCRGVPVFVAVIETARLAYGVDESFYYLAQVAASAGLWIEGMTNAVVQGKGAADIGVCTLEGERVVGMRPGQIGVLPPNARVAALPASALPPDPTALHRLMRRSIAAGLGLGYASLARDYSQTTFSSARAETLEERKHYKPEQVRLWRQHSMGWYRRRAAWHVTRALAGLPTPLKITAAEAAAWAENPETLLVHTILPEGWDWVNPLQEANAQRVALEAGVTSRPHVCAEMGLDYEEVVDDEVRAEAYRRRAWAAAGMTPPSPAAAQGTDGGDDKDTENGEEPADETANPRRGGRLNGTLNGAAHGAHA